MLMERTDRPAAVRPLVIVGAGGLAREVRDVLVARQAAALPGEWTWEFRGFVAEDQLDVEQGDISSGRWLGTPTEFLEMAAEPTGYVIGIGSSRVRREIAARFDEAGHQAVSLVHPSATFGADVLIGPGSVVCSHASLTTHIRIGRHVLINLNATVGHDVVISDFVTVNPLVAISGAVTVESGVLLGTTSCILQGLTVGTDAVVGAGAVVIRDVEAGATVVGVPARVVKEPEGIGGAVS
jgi:sugar O-acyltransferase (sialic acid O-acetyltransferase NeuD family)